MLPSTTPVNCIFVVAESFSITEFVCGREGEEEIFALRLILGVGFHRKAVGFGAMCVGDGKQSL